MRRSGAAAEARLAGGPQGPGGSPRTGPAALGPAADRTRPSAGLRSAQPSPAAPRRPPSRFLKPKAAGGPADGGWRAGPGPALVRGGLGDASRGRPGSILRRAAQIESKIRSRRSQAAGGRPVAFPDAAELPPSDGSSGLDSAPREGGRRRRAEEGGDGRMEAPRPRSAAETVEGKGSAQAPAKVSSLSAQRPLPGTSPLKRAPQAPASPPSQRTSPGPRSRGVTHSSSPLLQGSLAAEPTAQGPSPYERSLIQSLDELFSEAAGSRGSDHDGTSSSGSDFRVNILSLDDLVPERGSQEEEETREEEGRPLQMAGKPRKELGAAPGPPAPQNVFSAPKATNRKESTSEEEEEEGEMEISEQLGGPSEVLPSSSGEDGTPRGAEYSEDFEPSSAAASSSLSFVASEEGAERSLASSEEPQDRSEASLRSSRPESGSLKCPRGGLGSPQPFRGQRRVKDAAVQTGSPPPLPRWLQTDVPIIGLTIGGGSSVGAPPVGSPGLSLDALEALTAYSPAAFALNELLKENLLLIRQFAEASRCLHASLVASLEEEDFHYHTLEEAKRYISSHKAPPLTMEQALRETEEQREAAL